MTKKLFSNANTELLGKASLLVYFYLLGIFSVISAFHYYPFSDLTFLNLNNLLTLFFRWDSFHYQLIAIQGYDSVNTVFFPLYPLLVKIFSYLTGILWSGFLISWIFLILSLFVFYKILALRYREETMRQKVIALLLFSPFALFLTAYYTESLFLFLSLSFFYLLQKKKWLAAGLMAFLACLTRNVGIFLLAVYLFQYWQDFRTKGLRFKIKKEFFYSGLILAAPIIYGIYCYYHFGNPISFITEQANWTSHSFAWPWQIYGKYYALFTHEFAGNLPVIYQVVVKEIGAFLILLAAVIYFLRRREWPYAVYGSFSVLLFLTMVPMTSVNRYAIVYFPIYIFLTEVFKKDLAWFILFFLSFLYFVFNLFIFSYGAWVG